MKGSPMAVLIGLSRKGIICTVTQAFKRDETYLAQKAHKRMKKAPGDWKNEKKVYYLIFLAKIFHLFYRTMGIKRSDSRMETLFH